jgi:hypothetical protein
MFDLGSVPYKDSDELCVACVLSAHALSVQKGSLRYPAVCIESPIRIYRVIESAKLAR